MDEPPPTPVSLHHCLLTAAVVLLLVPGCNRMRGTRQAKRDSPPVLDVENPGTTRRAGDQSPSAKVALDGSAPADGTLQAPDAPTLDGQSVPVDVKQGDPATAALGSRKSAAGATATATIDEDSRPDGVTPAAVSNVRTGSVEAADYRTAEGQTSPANSGEPLTDLPGSFDVVGDGVKVKQGVVAATVNGRPIFVEDVLRDLPIDWDAYEKSVSPEQFRATRRQIIEQHLQRPIEEELLIQELKKKLKDDQLKQIVTQIDALFNKEALPNAMKQAGFETEVEFEQALRKKGSSIELLRTKNRNRELAHQYIGAKVMPKTGFDRPDLLKYWKEHQEDYAFAAQAKWEQIHLKFSKNGGKTGTRKKAEEIRLRLESGEDFAAIARKCSNGPNAAVKGGARGWTTKGTLKDQAVDEALFEQPLDEVGPAIEGPEGIDIIRVLDRTEAGVYPFAAVQEDIKAHLKNIEFQKASTALFGELTEKATIVKFIDKL